MSREDAFIACCGLNCRECGAYIATVNGDDELRKETARLWSRLNNANITPEMINCEGCRAEGVKTPFCESMCAIRRCVIEKGFDTCADCGEHGSCGRLAAIADKNPSALKNLGILKEDLC